MKMPTTPKAARALRPRRKFGEQRKCRCLPNEVTASLLGVRRSLGFSSTYLRCSSSAMSFMAMTASCNGISKRVFFDLVLRPLTARSQRQSMRVISLPRQPEACQHLRAYLFLLPCKLYYSETAALPLFTAEATEEAYQKRQFRHSLAGRQLKKRNYLTELRFSGSSNNH